MWKIKDSEIDIGWKESVIALLTIVLNIVIFASCIWNIYLFKKGMADAELTYYKCMTNIGWWAILMMLLAQAYKSTKN